MYLVYINYLNKNYKGYHQYEFIFSNTKDIEAGDDWDCMPASSGDITPPSKDYINKVGTLETNNFYLDLAIFSDCFSMIDCTNGIIAMGWETDEDNYDEDDDFYDTDDEKPLVFYFGEKEESVLKKLYSKDIKLNIIKT